MRDEHIIKQHGQPFVTYEGLLDLAHERGLLSIDTTLLMPPSPNNNTSIVKAVVEMQDGRKFSGIGDANPENVGRTIVPHITRMAETRAKARALRDALNIDAEIKGDVPIEPPASEENIKQLRGVKEVTPGGATTKSVNYLKGLWKEADEKGISRKTRQDVENERGPLEEWVSAKECSKYIDEFKVRLVAED